VRTNAGGRKQAPITLAKEWKEREGVGSGKTASEKSCKWWFKMTKASDLPSKLHHWYIFRSSKLIHPQISLL